MSEQEKKDRLERYVLALISGGVAGILAASGKFKYDERELLRVALRDAKIMMDLFDSEVWR